MDFVNANTEALLRFHRFHEQLNRSIKVQVMAYGCSPTRLSRANPMKKSGIRFRRTASSGVAPWSVYWAAEKGGEVGFRRNFEPYRNQGALRYAQYH
jgi:hypothetical protein